jgi:hypothetical protein
MPAFLDTTNRCTRIAWRFDHLDIEARRLGFVETGTAGPRVAPPPPTGMSPEDQEWWTEHAEWGATVYWHAESSTWLEVSGWLDDEPVLRLLSTWADGRVLITRDTYRRMPDPSVDPDDGSRAGRDWPGKLFILVLPAGVGIAGLLDVHTRTIPEFHEEPVGTGAHEDFVDALNRIEAHHERLHHWWAGQMMAIGMPIAFAVHAGLLWWGWPVVQALLLGLPVNVAVAIALRWIPLSDRAPVRMRPPHGGIPGGAGAFERLRARSEV